MLYNSFSKEIFPNIQSKPPLTQLQTHAGAFFLVLPQELWARFPSLSSAKHT